MLPRIKSVVDGIDQNGISKNNNWTGGGGFKFYYLSESLLVKDSKLGIYTINPKFSDEMLNQAICKIEGFRYKPKGNFHGYSSENRFIHITTRFVNQKYIGMLRNEIDEHQSLLVYCTKRQSELVAADNIEIKRIPKDLLSKCTFESEEET